MGLKASGKKGLQGSKESLEHSLLFLLKLFHFSQGSLGDAHNANLKAGSWVPGNPHCPVSTPSSLLVKVQTRWAPECQLVKGQWLSCSIWRASLRTYTGCFSDLLTQALGRDQEVQEEAQPVPLEVSVQEVEYLPQDSGCCGLKRRVEACQGILDGCVQGWGILGRGQEKIKVKVAVITRIEATSHDHRGSI